MIGWIVVAAAWCLTLSFSVYWAIPASLISLWKVFQLWFYHGRPWRRVHYPLMRTYSAAAGAESGIALREGREFSVDNALSMLLRSVHPDWNQAKAAAYIESQMERGRSEVEIQSICSWATRKGFNTNQTKDFEAFLRQAFASPDAGAMVRLVIAGLVEEKYGSTNRLEYLFEVATGRAK